MMQNREMVLFPTEEQFNEKTEELILDECYWTIPMYPANKERLIGNKIYFYDKLFNKIVLRATITGFGVINGKKTVIFDLIKEDKRFRNINLNKLNVPKRTQTRGWAYRWW